MSRSVVATGAARSVIRSTVPKGTTLTSITNKYEGCVKDDILLGEYVPLMGARSSTYKFYKIGDTLTPAEQTEERRGTDSFWVWPITINSADGSITMLDEPRLLVTKEFTFPEGVHRMWKITLPVPSGGAAAIPAAAALPSAARVKSYYDPSTWGLPSYYTPASPSEPKPKRCTILGGRKRTRRHRKHKQKRTRTTHLRRR